MRFLKLKVRKADIILIPIAAVLMYYFQKLDIERSTNEKLEQLLNDCKKEQIANDKLTPSCDKYTKMLYGNKQ